MADQGATLAIIKGMGDALLNGVIEMWFLITVGLLTALGFFGKRTLSRWDKVVASHMPDEEIKKHIKQVYTDMASCQKELKNDVTTVKDSVSEVHGRIDDIFHILIGEGSRRPARGLERKNNDKG
jgi:hypothetical protein